MKTSFKTTKKLSLLSVLVCAATLSINLDQQSHANEITKHSQNVTVQNFDQTYGVFPEAVVAFRTYTPDEHVQLVKAVQQYRAMHDTMKLDALNHYLTEHPDSPWKGSLLTNMGVIYEQQHYFSKAVTAFAQARQAMLHPAKPDQQALADYALAEELRLYAALGKAKAIEPLLKEFHQRTLWGGAEEGRARAESAVWEIKHTPEQVLRCGLVALYELLKLDKANPDVLAKLQVLPAHRYGTSLSDLKQIAGSLSHPMLMVQRTATEEIPVPSVMHLKMGHFAAITARQGDRYQVHDGVLGQSVWMTRDAINSESSGYFLTKTSTLPLVSTMKASQIIGAGNTNSPPPPPPPCGGSGGGSKGMPVCSINNAQTSLTLNDTPLAYPQAMGSDLSFNLHYFQKNTGQPAVQNFSNVSPMWSYNWMAYIQDDPNSLGANVSIYARDGGYWRYGGFNSSNGYFTPEQYSQAQLVRTSSTPVTYERHLKNGTVEVYGQSDAATNAPRKIFLSKIIDPRGQAVTLSYDNQSRLITVANAVGNSLSFSYQDSSAPLQITGVTDDTGRNVVLTYDSNHRLQSITDVVGMTTTFAYDSGTFINSMTTPYGTTRYASGQSGYHWWLTSTDPLGYTERQEFLHAAPGIPFSESIVPQAKTSSIRNIFINYRNSYHWDKATMQAMGGTLDYTKAHIDHWLHAYNDPTWSVPVPILESRKEPLENRVWSFYTGQPDPLMAGPSAQPNEIARVLGDGSTQSYLYSYNSIGNKTSETDPAGRVTYYDYAPNGIDIIQIRQAFGNQQDTVAKYTYNGLHEPLTATDAAGQTTTYAYDSNGLKTSETNAKGETTQYRYDSHGNLTQIINAAGQVQHRYTYDATGNMLTDTDSEGYMLTYKYDALNRLISTTYPDGTMDQTIYDKLDVSKVINRLGQITSYSYDANRNKITETDPLGNVIHYGYDPSGRLISLTDANGHTTTWVRDIQGRVISKTYPNGGTYTAGYDSAGRLVTTTDPLHQTKQMTYGIDNLVRGINYVNAVNPTANVTFTPDTLYPRTLSMQDGTGTTTYKYVPAGTLGALKLAEEDSPDGGNAIMKNTYDVLGRVISSTIGTATNTMSYDNLGRMIQHQSPLGTFQYTYLGQTGLITNEVLQGQKWQTVYTYGTSQQDRQLQSISHPITLSVYEQFCNWLKSLFGNRVQTTTGAPTITYTTGPEDQILSRTDVNGVQSYTYDNDQRLTAVVASPLRGGGDHTDRDEDRRHSIEKHEDQDHDRGNRRDHDNDDHNHGSGGTSANSSYGYDAAFNILSKVEPTSNNSFTVNPDNQVMTQNSLNWIYDANGNVLDDGKNSYLWDAENRLIQITSKMTSHISKFTYNGLSKRTSISEASSATTPPTVTHYLWCGSKPCESHTTTGSTQSLYYPQGEFNTITNTSQYYALDNLGSVVQVVDASGVVKGQRVYSAYGVVTHSSGTIPTFGYANMYQHVPTGLNLTWYRAYSPDTGRWLSKDSIGESGGLNLYGYVGENPENLVDPDGRNPIAAVVWLCMDGGCSAIANLTFAAWLAWLESRGKSDPVVLPIVNPGRDCHGNCKPCPSGASWGVSKPGHGHKGGYVHVIVYNQNPITCDCYPDRPSQGLQGF